MIKINARRLGTWGEEVARRYYEDLGYECLDHSWNGSSGEIDLVLLKDGTVVFTEVKTRTSDAFGSPAAAVDRRKQGKVRSTATEWLRDRDESFPELRFDVASVNADGDVEVLEGCF